MLRVRYAAWLLAANATLGSAVPAHADTTIFRDPRGDAPARFDLTRTAISNGQDRIMVNQRVRDLLGRGSQIYGFNVQAGSYGAVVQTVRRANGDVIVRVLGDSECRDARAHWQLAENLIQVSMPRECIAQDGTLMFSTMIGAGDGTAGDPTDWTRTVRIAQS